MCEIKQPNVEDQVESWLCYWGKLEQYDPVSIYVPQRDFLDDWFGQLGNRNLCHVISKAKTLNSLFSTRASFDDLKKLANRIVQMEDFDKRLKDVNKDLVNEIAGGKGKKRGLYSLATKYCSFHYPEKYPIYDSNVDEALWHFEKNRRRKNPGCKKFNRRELICYERFHEVMTDFKDGLNKEPKTEFSFREIDKYLFLVGRRLKEEEKKRKQG